MSEQTPPLKAGRPEEGLMRESFGLSAAVAKKRESDKESGRTKP